MVQVKWSSLVMIIIILIAAAALTHVADIWTVPIQNDTTIDQLNGGDAEMVIMHSTNSMLATLRTVIFPIAILICLLIVALEVKRIIKENEVKTDN